MKVGRRLAIKILNASKFALTSARAAVGAITVAGRSRDADGTWPRSSREATAAFEDYDYARVLQRTETFFWGFCDDYLELVKGRRYGEQGADAARLGERGAHRGAVGDAAAVRAVPAVCHRGSLVVVAGGLDPPGAVADGRRARRRSSPTTRRDDGSRRTSATYEWATDVLFEVRKQRSEAKQPLKVPITKVSVTADAGAAALMPIVEADLRAALRVQAFETAIGEPRAIVVAGYEPVAIRRRIWNSLRLWIRRSTATSCAARSTKTSRDGDITTDATVPAVAAGARRLPGQADCVLAGLDVAFEAFRLLEPGVRIEARRRDGELGAPRARRSPSSSDRRARCSSASAPRSISCSGSRHRDAGAPRSSTRPAAASPSSTRARRRRRCGRSRSTRSAPAARRQPSRRPVRRDPHQGQPHPPRRRRRRRAVERARAHRPGLPVEIEAETLDQVDQALAAGAETILVDNMSTADIRVRGRPRRGAAPRSRSPAASRSSASPSSRRPAPTSSSVGALTHSAPAIDISFEIEPA